MCRTTVATVKKVMEENYPIFGLCLGHQILALAAGALAAWTELGPFWGTVTGGISIIAAGVMLYVIPKSKVGRRMVLDHSQADAVSQQDRSDHEFPD